MKKYDYSFLEKYYIYPQHIEKYEFESHLIDIDAIRTNNLIDFSALKTKKYYYFIMPNCGHPEFISLTKLRVRLSSDREDLLCCRICRWFIDSGINYDKFSKLYSTDNKIPLSNINYRGEEVLFTCPECDNDTHYKEIRWVLDNLKNGDSFTKYCKCKCNSIGSKYPNLVPLWDKKRNKEDIFSLPADDYNIHHARNYFNCIACNNPINTPMTVYNAISNSPRCIKHKIKKGTSFPEMAIFFSFYRSLSKLPYIKVNHRYKYYRNYEFDIYIVLELQNEHIFAVEVDGRHHKKRKKQDEAKNEDAKFKNIHLERVRDISLKEIRLDNFDNIIQRTSKDKTELTTIIPKLLNSFRRWVKNTGINKNVVNEINSAILQEIKSVDVIRDEKPIFLSYDKKPKKLLKDEPFLQPIYNQLREDIRQQLGDFISITEQDIKRPFICKKCGGEWEQFVNVVVQNFKNSKSGYLGCPNFCM